VQFYLNGFLSGDPSIAGPNKASEATTAVSGNDQVDVLIIGCGPAGLTLAAQLAAFPDIKTMIVDQKSGPLLMGQADGIACRTMEMLEAFGFAERVLKESYWVNEVSFWKPDKGQRNVIVRSDRVRDTEDGLSEFPHVILNQARIHDFYLDVMRNSASRLEPCYSLKFLDLTVEPNSFPHSYPVKVRLERLNSTDEHKIETVQARYVVGCDGARSGVRRALGLELSGDSANQAWGVMDVLAITDFPDIRLKTVIHSASEGSVLIIPREGGYLVRMYIELDKLDPDKRVADLGISIDQLIATAQRIVHPYSLDVKEVVWWSIYEIGQRLCEKFDDVPAGDKSGRHPRVFIAGDACHTHSPKAGQGMNVSMQDSFNLGWKLASVLRGLSAPDLLNSYSAERRAIAKELIDFDREFARMFSAAPKCADDPTGDGVDPAEFKNYFVRQGRFTAGTATRYEFSMITAVSTHQHLAHGFQIGTRFHSAPVIRLSDTRPVQLSHCFKADGRWRVVALVGKEDAVTPGSRWRNLCHFLISDPNSPIVRYTGEGADIDSVIDVRAVFQWGHRDVTIEQLPELLRPRKGRLGLKDYEKAFCAKPNSPYDLFALRGIDSEQGCVIIIRPDQHVAGVLPIEDHGGLSTFFARVMLPQ